MKKPVFKLNTLTTALLAASLLVAPIAVSHDHGHDDHGHDDHGHDDHGHDDHGHDDVRQLGAHVHGAAQLLVAVDHDHVDVLLQSPSYNVVGFEHFARHEADEALLLEAEEKLLAAEYVFQLASAANCSLDDVDLVSEQLAEMRGEEFEVHYHEHGHDDHGHDDHGHDDHGHDDHGHDDHGHDDHGHDDHGHDDHGHDDHGHDDHGHDDHGHDDHSSDDHGERSVHTEFNLEYRFHCDNIGALNGLEVTAFDNFPGFESVDVQWIVNGQQGAARTQPGSRSVQF
ncbi:ZrgA family zinc uptake protein [Natronospirillum operosum]|uniref:ZrgA family zinc uptake protein n=1 Tax=Natronospirillum operosum TaxID=2759953 RepID=UPI00197BF404|nr:DUF2796 domain-containing protein [Natronospirillum operosum]